MASSTSQVGWVQQSETHQLWWDLLPLHLPYATHSFISTSQRDECQKLTTTIDSRSEGASRVMRFLRMTWYARRRSSRTNVRGGTAGGGTVWALTGTSMRRRVARGCHTESRTIGTSRIRHVVVAMSGRTSISLSLADDMSLKMESTRQDGYSIGSRITMSSRSSASVVRIVAGQ